VRSWNGRGIKGHATVSQSPPPLKPLSSTTVAKVSAYFTYFTLPEDGSKPWIDINADSATGQHARNWKESTHKVKTEDLRGNESTASLNTSVFRFICHHAMHKAVTDGAEIERKYRLKFGNIYITEPGPFKAVSALFNLVCSSDSVLRARQLLQVVSGAAWCVGAHGRDMDDGLTLPRSHVHRTTTHETPQVGL
jgi:hypothetical protein